MSTSLESRRHCERHFYNRCHFPVEPSISRVITDGKTPVPKLDRKFTGGPFVGLLFSKTEGPQTGFVTLEFDGGFKLRISLTEYNLWPEK
jgi:hypothetical protein